MSREMKIGVALVILAGLGAGAYFQQKKDARQGTEKAASADLPDFKGTDDVDKIDITTAKGEVVLEKKGDKWELTKPLSAMANQSNVTSLLNNLKEIKVTEVIAKTPDEDLKKNYELDKEKSLHLVTFKGGEKKLDATFGKSGGRGNMAMLEGKPDIYAVSSYSGYLYSRQANDFRDKEIFKFDDASVTGLTIANKNGTFVFTKGDKWAGKFKDKAIERFDESKVTNAVNSFKSLNAEDFGDGKPASDTGLDSPDATVTLSLKDGTHVLKVGKVATGSSHYALRDADSTIFVVGSFVNDWANAEVSKFQTPLDGGAKDAAPPSMPPGMGGMGGMHGMPGMPPGHP